MGWSCDVDRLIRIDVDGACGSCEEFGSESCALSHVEELDGVCRYAHQGIHGFGREVGYDEDGFVACFADECKEAVGVHQLILVVGVHEVVELAFADGLLGVA